MARDERHPAPTGQPDGQPHADRGRHTVTPRSHAPPPDGEPDGEHGEQIVLREIDPSGQPSTVANGSAGPAPPPRPSVAASLLQALTDDPAAATPPAGAEEQPIDVEASDHTDAPGDTGVVETAGNTEPDGETTEPDADPDVADADTETETATDIADADAGAATGDADTDTGTGTGDADTAEAETHAGTAPLGNAEAATGTTAAGDPPAADSTTEPEREPIGSRVRTLFREIGGWTAAAQIGLLIVSLLCVFQVVVLLVVLRFLGEAEASDTVETADMLLAHRRATTIMLPALVISALAAAALAIWRIRRDTDDAAPAAGLLGVPASLWAMVAAAGVVAAMAATSGASTPAEAQRGTLLAVAACALLGATAFIAPRGLAAATDGDRSASPNDDPADAASDGR